MFYFYWTIALSKLLTILFSSKIYKIYSPFSLSDKTKSLFFLNFKKSLKIIRNQKKSYLLNSTIIENSKLSIFIINPFPDYNILFNEGITKSVISLNPKIEIFY